MDPALRWREPSSTDSSASVRLGHYPPRRLTVWHQIEGHSRIAVIFKLANDGHDTPAVQHYLGHKNIQHTVRYTESHQCLEVDHQLVLSRRLHRQVSRFSPSETASRPEVCCPMDPISPNCFDAPLR
jgi:Phage integrase family